MNTSDNLQKEGIDFINQLAEGDYSGACRDFDANMAQAMPAVKLEETWLQLIGMAGSFQTITTSKGTQRGEKYIVILTCQFDKSALDMYVVFNQDGQIAGLSYLPTPTHDAYNPPAYVRTDAFQEAEVTVGSGEWALPGTLSMPVGAGPFPAVVLVHGSGPNDRDETIGPNRPFRDIAWGLACQGIAVLRYEKRTKAHAEKFTPEIIARLTSREEVIDDALNAVKLLRQTPGIDPSRVYVLGHSLGATLAPRIGQADPALAGLIIAAGLARPLEDTILDQFTHIYSLSGEMTDSQKAELEQLKEKVARVKDPNLSEKVPAEDLPLNITPAYWLDLRGYIPPEVAKSLDMRILVLQGGRDYQVSADKDFPVWQKVLDGKQGATLKLYPKLFHLFIEGEGPARPDEYLKEGPVSQEVVQDIIGWIKDK
jgi:dienelactone hydrolase